MRSRKFNTDERGAALLEFAIGASLFFTAIFAVLEFGVLLWTHNALTEASRRGARYAVNHRTADIEDVQNVVVYGAAEPSAGAKPLVKNLTPTNVKVEYPGFGVGAGRAAVRIEGYQFNFIVPLFGKKLAMPEYRTALPGENAGEVPSNIAE